MHCNERRMAQAVHAQRSAVQCRSYNAAQHRYRRSRTFPDLPPLFPRIHIHMALHCGAAQGTALRRGLRCVCALRHCQKFPRAQKNDGVVSRLWPCQNLQLPLPLPPHCPHLHRKAWFLYRRMLPLPLPSTAHVTRCTHKA